MTGGVWEPRRGVARTVRLVLVALGAMQLGGCADTLGEGAELMSMLEPSKPEVDLNDPQQALEHWRAEYAKSPRSLEPALEYAKALKAIDKKREALGVLQQASATHGRDRKLASEYGRLALEMDQITLARQLLEVADDPAKPDWRVVLARGTVYAKQGNYAEAIPHFERARGLAPDQPSVMNNLALAYAMKGDAAAGEQLLRTAASGANAPAKVQQNLALVLGLQGKYAESSAVGSSGLPADQAKANADYLRKVVQIAPKPMASNAVADGTRPAWPAPVVRPIAMAEPVAVTRSSTAEEAAMPPIVPASFAPVDGAPVYETGSTAPPARAPKRKAAAERASSAPVLKSSAH